MGNTAVSVKSSGHPTFAIEGHLTEITEDYNETEDNDNVEHGVMTRTMDKVDGTQNSALPIIAIEAPLTVVQEDNNVITGIDEDIDMTIIDEDFEISGSLLGQQRKSLAEMYDLYRRHACTLGFSVRKNITRTREINGVKVAIEKYYVCSCEGVMKSKVKNSSLMESDSSKKKKKMLVTRTDCKAFIRVKLNEVGLYEVVAHVVAHNHGLTRKEWQHLHRSERNIDESKGKAIEVMTESGMKPSIQYSFMVEESGGVENVGHTQKDHYNFVNKLKMKDIEGGDAQTLIDLLHQASSEDPNLFFRVKLDENGRLSNVFWRDSMMLEDFQIFGDVMVFDTTYRTNKYNLICAPFVGINNHWRNVIFACSFISDETIDSFEWLFSIFKKSMRGLSPTSIFTDQDHAIANAIEKVFPNTRHRLCQWHIQQKANSHYGTLRNDKTFKAEFEKCMKGCYSEEEFEMCWNKMIVNHNLVDNTWFQRLYQLRYKWSTALSKDFFSAGMLSSQRSESTNSALGFKATKKTSLTDFFGIFEETVARWRAVEQRDEFDCSRSVHDSSSNLCGLLKHAKEVYTRSLYEDFEKEFIYSMSTCYLVQQICEDRLIYAVFPENKPEHMHQVTFLHATKNISCTCKNFEEIGWLCFHYIRVLHLNSVIEIPLIYISKRWTKYAKQDVWKKFDAGDANVVDMRKNCIPWRHMMARRYYNLILKCHTQENARSVLEKGYDRDVAEVEELFQRMRVDESLQGNIGADSEIGNTSTVVLDIIYSITKGRKPSWKKGHMEKGKSKKQKARGREFGTKTPNIRLF